jgi:hypothetical protein
VHDLVGQVQIVEAGLAFGGRNRELCDIPGLGGKARLGGGCAFVGTVVTGPLVVGALPVVSVFMPVAVFPAGCLAVAVALAWPLSGVAP